MDGKGEILRISAWGWGLAPRQHHACLPASCKGCKSPGLHKLFAQLFALCDAAALTPLHRCVIGGAETVGCAVQLRARVWPLLLGEPSGGTSQEEYAELATREHKDSTVVECDVARSLWSLTKGAACPWAVLPPLAGTLPATGGLVGWRGAGGHKEAVLAGSTG
jgi:hypothetical protein